MRVRATELVADALVLFRQDRELLLGLAGPFWLLPILALRLLSAPMPQPPSDLRGDPAAVAAWTQAFSGWLGAHGGWFLLALGVAAWGTTTVYALYLDQSRPDLRAALRLGAKLWPRFMLMSAVVGLMAMAGLALLYLPGLYILGRLAPAGPALLAERPLGAVGAIGRGFAITRGAGLPLMAVTAATLGLGWLLPQPLLALDAWLRAQGGGGNTVALATVNALAAAIATLTALITVLIAVAAYRRLAR